MERRFRRVLPLVLAWAAAGVLFFMAGSVQAAAKKELKKENGAYHFYIDGEMQKDTWITYKGRRYYFKSNGDAAIGSFAVKKVYYIFDGKGRLITPEKKTVVTIKKVKYQVKKGGKAAPGWDADKKWYFTKSGRQLTKGWTADGKYYMDKKGEKTVGIAVIMTNNGVFDEGMFYYFNKTGKLNASRTKQLQMVSVYEIEMTGLYKLIGKPLKAKYYGNACYAGPKGDEPGGMDGILTYKTFTVDTYRTKDKKREYFLGASPR